jgi:hypothetical protein
MFFDEIQTIKKKTRVRKMSKSENYFNLQTFVNDVNFR